MFAQVSRSGAAQRSCGTDSFACRGLLVLFLSSESACIEGEAPLQDVVMGIREKDKKGEGGARRTEVMCVCTF